MRKISIIFMVFALLASVAACTKDQGPAAGKSVGEIYVTSKSGMKTVLVSLNGLWRVTSLVNWISVDVNGRNGESAFTLSYTSNESDCVRTNQTRRGAVVIEDLTRNVADTVYLRQQGTPDGNEYGSAPQDSYIEFIDVHLIKKTVKYVSFKGCDDVEAVKNWISNCGADVVALTWTEKNVDKLASGAGFEIFTRDSVAVISIGNNKSEIIAQTKEPSSIAVEIDGVAYHVADFSRGQNAYTQLMKVLDAGYNCPGMSSKWIVGGTFYYLSVMETGYPDTPGWYPAHPSDSAFDADRYAQDNLLTDCVWMTSRRFNSTFTENGKSWRADYAYASNEVWNSTVAVTAGDAPVSGALHGSITLTIKY